MLSICFYGKSQLVCPLILKVMLTPGISLGLHQPNLSSYRFEKSAGSTIPPNSSTSLKGPFRACSLQGDALPHQNCQFLLSIENPII